MVEELYYFVAGMDDATGSIRMLDDKNDSLPVYCRIGSRSGVFERSS